MNIFEKAAKGKYRFNSMKGNLSVEDLYDLPLTSAQGVSLDGLAIDVNREIKATEEESFVSENKPNTILAAKFDILKHIIKAKIEEIESAKLAAGKKAKKAELVGILAEMEAAALRTDNDPAAIRKMIAEL